MEQMASNEKRHRILHWEVKRKPISPCAVSARRRKRNWLIHGIFGESWLLIGKQNINL
jgi:hypothetical protein